MTLDVRALYLNWLSIHGTTMGSSRDFAALMRMVETGSWSPVIDSVRPLADAEAAHDRMKAGEHFGKLVRLTRRCSTTRCEIGGRVARASQAARRASRDRVAITWGRPGPRSSLRDETPPRRSSPCLRVRMNTCRSAPFLNGIPLSVTNVRVAQPDASVNVSGGIETRLNGTPVGVDERPAERR